MRFSALNARTDLFAFLVITKEAFPNKQEERISWRLVGRIAILLGIKETFLSKREGRDFWKLGSSIAPPVLAKKTGYQEGEQPGGRKADFTQKSNNP